MRTGRELVALKTLNEHIDAIHFSPDGTRVVTSSPGKIRMWDAATGVELLALPTPLNLLFAGFSADGSRLGAWIWDGSFSWLSFNHRLQTWDATPINRAIKQPSIPQAVPVMDVVK
jgi:WD40 repeat protein